MSAKSKDTTKTAHVMNLLRKNTAAGAETPRQAETTTEMVSETVQVKTTPVKHPIITSLNEEAAVSLEIKDALEQELEKNERRTAEAPAAQLQMESQPLNEGGSVKESPALQVSEGENESKEELTFDSMDEAEPVDEPVEASSVMAEEAAPAEASVKEIFNVMQVMVDESAQKYMTMFGLCDCPRCRADVRAIALNNLQPKYVVMEEGEYIPRITLYEQQFRVPVTAQILRACNIVAENPRHNRP